MHILSSIALFGCNLLLCSIDIEASGGNYKAPKGGVHSPKGATPSAPKTTSGKATKCSSSKPSKPAATAHAIFSSDFLYKYCRKAQQLVAKTDIVPFNTVFDDLGVAGTPFPPPGTPSTGFIASFPLPYNGAENLPLTTTQHIGFSTGEDAEDAQTVMCKMKNAEAINTYFPGEASEGNDCVDVSKYVVDKVTASLEDCDPDFSRYTSTITYLNWVTYSGEQWTDDSPAPTAYIKGGVLHIVSKQLVVDPLNPSPFVGDEKKGIIYCQTIAPYYLRKIVEGDIAPPTCEDPPTYTQPGSGPPEPPKSWICPGP